MFLKSSWCQLIFLTTRGTIATDLEIAASEDPKSADGVTVAVASATARDFHVIIAATLKPRHLPHLYLAKHRRTTVHRHDLSHFNTIRHLPLSLTHTYALSLSLSVIPQTKDTVFILDDKNRTECE